MTNYKKGILILTFPQKAKPYQIVAMAATILLIIVCLIKGCIS